MGLFSGIGKVFSKVTSFVNKVADFVKKPLDFVMKPLQGLVGKVLDKLPFGLGNLIKPFADKFLSSALGFLAGGPLGGLFSMISKASNVIGTVQDVLNGVNGVLNGGTQNLPAPAQENLQEGTAWSIAQGLS